MPSLGMNGKNSLLVLDARALTEKAHERVGGAAQRDETVEEVAGDHVVLAQHRGRDEVLALQLLDQLVVLVEPCGRALQGLAAQGEALVERRLLHNRAPAAR